MIRIDLLPQAEGKSRRRSGGPVFDQTKVVPLAALSVVLTACMAVMMLQSAREKSLERDVAVARAESEKYKQTIALIDEMVRKENELNRRLDIVRSLDQNRYRTVAVLDEMAKRVPNYLWLTSVKEVAGNRLAIDGLAFSNLVISDLMTNLDESKVFQGVELSVARRKAIEGQNVVNFTLTTAVDNAGTPHAKAAQAAAASATVQSDAAAPAIQIPAAAPAGAAAGPGDAAAGETNAESGIEAAEPRETVGG